MASVANNECISTEYLLATIDKIAKEMLERNFSDEEVFVGSIDTKALYPSLDIKKSGKICRKIVRKFENVDWWWMMRYLALSMEELDIRRKRLSDVIPKKRAKKGKKPTVRTITDDDKTHR